MADSPSQSQSVTFDPAAAAAYTRAAAAVAEILGTAADHTYAAADADLSGLGLLGQDFARAWSDATAAQAASVRIAAAVLGVYSAAVQTAGAELGAVDTATADALTSAAREV